MAELFGHLTRLELIQVIIECWNNIFLLVLIFTMSINIRQNKENDFMQNVKIPMTVELLEFYLAVFIYNFCHIVYMAVSGTTAKYSACVVNSSMFVYYIAGGGRPCFFCI